MKELLADAAAGQAGAIELEHLRVVEQEARSLIAYIDDVNRRHPERRVFVPQTMSFAEAVRPVLDQLDAIRAHTGAGTAEGSAATTT
jgi:hypothetical protein